MLTMIFILSQIHFRVCIFDKRFQNAVCSCIISYNPTSFSMENILLHINLSSLSSCPPPRLLLSSSVSISLHRSKPRVAASFCTSISQFEIMNSRCNCVPSGAASSSSLFGSIACIAYLITRNRDCFRVEIRGKNHAHGRRTTNSPSIVRQQRGDLLCERFKRFRIQKGLGKVMNVRRQVPRERNSPRIVIYRYRPVHEGEEEEEEEDIGE